MQYEFPFLAIPGFLSDALEEKHHNRTINGKKGVLTVTCNSIRAITDIK